MTIHHESPSPLRGLLTGLAALGLVAVLGAALAPRAGGTMSERALTAPQEEPAVTPKTETRIAPAAQELPPIDRTKPKSVATATFGLG